MKVIPSLTGPLGDPHLEPQQAGKILHIIAQRAGFEIVRFCSRVLNGRLGVFGIGDENKPEPLWREWVFELESGDGPRLLLETSAEVVSLSETQKPAFAKMLRGTECCPGTAFMLGTAPVCIRFSPPDSPGFEGTAFYLDERAQVREEGHRLKSIDICCEAYLLTGEFLQIVRQVLIAEQPMYEGHQDVWQRGYFPTRIRIKRHHDRLEITSTFNEWHGFSYSYSLEQGYDGPTIKKGSWWVS